MSNYYPDFVFDLDSAVNLKKILVCMLSYLASNPVGAELSKTERWWDFSEQSNHINMLDPALGIWIVLTPEADKLVLESRFRKSLSRTTTSLKHFLSGSSVVTLWWILNRNLGFSFSLWPKGDFPQTLQTTHPLIHYHVYLVANICHMSDNSLLILFSQGQAMALALCFVSLAIRLRSRT